MLKRQAIFHIIHAGPDKPLRLQHPTSRAVAWPKGRFMFPRCGRLRLARPASTAQGRPTRGKKGGGGGNGAFAFGSGRCAEVACAGAGAQRMQGDEAARDAIGNRRIATLAPQTRPMAPRGVPAQRDAAWGTTAAGQAVVELGRFGPTVAESNIWRRSTKVGRFWPNPGRPKRTPS